MVAPPGTCARGSSRRRRPRIRPRWPGPPPVVRSGPPTSPGRWTHFPRTSPAQYLAKGAAFHAKRHSGDRLASPPMAREWTEVFDLGAGATIASAATESEQPERRGGVFRRLRENLARSREALTAEVSASFFDQLDAEAFERLEEALILADVGAPVTAEVVGKLEAE